MAERDRKGLRGLASDLDKAYASPADAWPSTPGPDAAQRLRDYRDTTLEGQAGLKDIGNENTDPWIFPAPIPQDQRMLAYQNQRNARLAQQAWDWMPETARGAAYRMGGLAGMESYDPEGGFSSPQDAAEMAARRLTRPYRGVQERAGTSNIGAAAAKAGRMGSVVAAGARDWIEGPGRAMRGEMSEQEMADWGAGTAFGMLGGGRIPGGAPTGSVGSAGAKLGGKPGGPWEGGIRAYHSSPYDFDKFDWSKLRTGEGANTYGAGFYFAENPAVSGQGGQYWNQFKGRFPDLDAAAAEALRKSNFDRDAAIAHARGLSESMKDFAPNIARQQRDVVSRLESGDIVGPRTYEVNINARPELLLDWDKPMTRQLPEVLGAVEKVYPGAVNAEQAKLQAAMADLKKRYPTSDPMGQQAAIQRSLDKMDTGSGFTGKDLMSRLFMRPGATEESTAVALREAGIPGIRYLDQGSRGVAKQADELLKIYQTPERVREVAQQAIKSGSGDSDYWQSILRGLGDRSYNYVVTDPSKLDILAKYGIVGGAPIGMGALVAQDRYGAAP